MMEIGSMSDGPDPEFSGGLVWSDKENGFRREK